MLLPGAQQRFAVLPQVADYTADFMGRIPGVDREGHVVQPEFGFVIATPHMNMRGFVAFV
jgi:hypothetical protein